MNTPRPQPGCVAAAAALVALLSLAPLAPALAQSTAGAQPTIEIHHATEAELDSVRGIGPDLSARLLAERNKAPFRDWADLIARVKPMGPTQARRLSEAGLRVNGQAYAAP